MPVEMPFADLALARRVEAAWDRLGVENGRSLLRRSPGSGADVLAVGGGHAVFLGAGSPISQAQGLGLEGPVDERDIEAMEAFFRDRGSETRVEVASLADPGLLTMLSVRGYRIAEQTHTLVRPLDPAFDPPDPPKPDGAFEIVRVEADRFATLVATLMDCFFEPPDLAPAALSDGAMSMGGVPGVSGWLARVDGAPAGAGVLATDGGLALICGDGTLSTYRGRGIQSALLRLRLEHARAVGCELASICTAPGSGSQRNAERQGFRLAYARTMMMRD